MPKPSVEFLNARRALKPASGGATQSRAVKYAPDSDLDLWERTDLAIQSAWFDAGIRSQAMWEQIFARFGLEFGEPVDEIPF